MAILHLIAFSLLLLVTSVARAEDLFLSGAVFHDRNRNGVRERFESGIRGVAVSNGREVAVTDWRGRYQLPVEDDTIIFVIKPEGWATPVDQNQIPRFFYIHKPAGSPEDLEFPGVAPTGPLPEELHFPLYRQKEPRSFQAIVFADTQPRFIEEVDHLAHDIVEELIGTEAAFGITLGDIVGDDLSLFDPLNRAVGQIGIPWYNVIGNHDVNLHARSDRYSDETFERFYGPATYAFAYGKVHFIVLDNIVYEGMDRDQSRAGGYWGELSDRQLEFVKNYLATVPRKRLVVLAMHIPFDSPPHVVRNFRDLLQILRDRPNTLSLSGHTHFQESQFFGREEGFDGSRPHHQLIHTTASGSWWLGAADELGIPHATMNDGAPNGYTIIHFDGHRYTTRFKAARRPADYQMNVFAPESTTSESAGEVEVLVNFFAGSERARVEMRLGADGDWTLLSREARKDPYYLAAIERDLQRNPRPQFFLPPAILSSHQWVGTLPPNPPTGTHTLEVRATDMYEQVFHAFRLIRID
jgi:3',5'-cyclic AMP phosphodiesterase CpdA